MCTRPDKLLIKAPAKINLCLEVLEARENGYHDIRSVMVPVSLYDELVLEKTDSAIETVCSANGKARAEGSETQLAGENGLCPASQKDNLATRAVILLKQATDYSGGALIHLEKNIPVGGGLGGGSADAAAVLRGLNKLWQTNVSRETLMKIGSHVGSDVPAMVHGGLVCMEGFGEKVTPVSVVSARLSAEAGRDAETPAKKGQDECRWVVLVNPGFSVSTRDIYSRYSMSLTSRQRTFNNMISVLGESSPDPVAGAMFNDLQETVFEKYPLIAIVAEALEKAGAIGVLLAGSGSSVFGLARDEEHASSINRRMKEVLEFPVWSRIARTLPDGVMAAHGPLEA